MSKLQFLVLHCTATPQCREVTADEIIKWHTAAKPDGHGWKKWNIEGKTGIQEVPYTHTNNFYAREVLEKIPQPWYEARLADDGLNRGNHVDYTFLDKIKAVGYPIYLNLDVEVLHDGIGRKDYERARSG